MVTHKTLNDCIRTGRHEFVAFVKNRVSPNSSNFHTIGNDLGKIYFGVLVCERDDIHDDDQLVEFFHKEAPRYKGDSDIVFGDFSYKFAEVVSEVPLGIEINSFYSGCHLKRNSKEFREARKLMKKYGVY